MTENGGFQHGVEFSQIYSGPWTDLKFDRENRVSSVLQNRTNN